MTQYIYKKFRMEYMPIFFAVSMLLLSGEVSAEIVSNLSMDRVYQGAIHLPDFSGRDRQFSRYRTSIANEMKSGPNFAGHFAIVEIGCGTSCRFAFIGDVATGKVFNFPYGGEYYYMLDLRYEVKSNSVYAKWIDFYKNECLYDYLTWDGEKFRPLNPRVIGPREKCDL